MKILQIGKYFPPYKGGIENNTHHCCVELAVDHEVFALVFNGKKQTLKEKIQGIPVVRVGSFGKIYSQELTHSLVYYIRKIKPDIIHLHAPNPIAVISILLAAPFTPLVITHHTDIIRQRVLKHIFSPFYKILLARALSIILYTEQYGLTSKEVKPYQRKFKIIPHGTSEKPFIFSQKMEKQVKEIQENFTKNAPTICFIGRHVKYKGVDNLLHAVKALPGIHALIGGDGPSLKKSKKLAVQLGIHDRVHFLGKLHDFNKGAVFRASDIFVLPCLNRTESFGQSLVEAQLSKIPTIASDVGGISEVTIHGKTGLVIKPDCIDELTKSIKMLLHDSEMRKEMGEAGYKRAKTYFTDTVTGPKLRKHFNDISANIAIEKFATQYNCVTVFFSSLYLFL